MEYFSAQLAFQFPELVTQCRLGEEEMIRSLLQAAQFMHCFDEPEVTYFQHSELFS
jgi:hypothetical protein